MAQVQTRKLELLRVENAERIEEPVVKRTVVLIFHRTERVGDLFNRIGLTVRPIVHGVDAPLVARAMMARLANAVHDRIAQIQIRRSHVNFRAQRARAIFELARAHPSE